MYPIMTWCFLIRYIFWMLLHVIQGISSPRGLLRVCVIVFPCYLSIQPFWYVLSIPIYNSKIILLSLHPVVCMSSRMRMLVRFSLFWKHMFRLNCLNLSWYHLSLFPLQISFDFSLQVVLSGLTAFFFFLCFWSSHLPYFFFLRTFACCGSFSTCPFSLISHPGFCISVRVPLRNTDFFTD